MDCLGQQGDAKLFADLCIECIGSVQVPMNHDESTLLAKQSIAYAVCAYSAGLSALAMSRSCVLLWSQLIVVGVSP